MQPEEGRDPRGLRLERAVARVLEPALDQPSAQARRRRRRAGRRRRARRGRRAGRAGRRGRRRAPRRTPPTSVATTGSPEASASFSTCGTPSVNETWTNACALAVVRRAAPGTAGSRAARSGRRRRARPPVRARRPRAGRAPPSAAGRRPGRRRSSSRDRLDEQQRVLLGVDPADREQLDLARTSRAAAARRPGLPRARATARSRARGRAL